MNQESFAKIILVVVIVVLIGAAGYFVFVKKSEPVAQQHTPISTTTLTKTSVSPTPISTPRDEKADWKTYTNNNFNFQLTFTDAWKGYKVFSSQGSQGVGAPTYLDFSMPTTDKSSFVSSVTDQVYGYAAIFEITIVAKDRQYQGVGIKITEDKDNIYSYVTNGVPNDLQRVNFEIAKIISTFKFTE